MTASTLELIVTRSPRLLPTTRRLYLSSVRSFIAHAGTAPRAWTLAAVESWRDRLHGDGLAAGSINTKLHALRYASGRYAKLGHGPDFAADVELLPVRDQRKTRIALTDAQAASLLAACAGGELADVRDEALLTLALRTGLRREEVVSITTTRWDRRAGRITVRIKGGNWLDVFLDAETQGALDRWASELERHGIAGVHLFRSISQKRIDGRRHFGQALSADGFYKILAARAEKAGLGHVHPHLLRHTFYSLALLHGASPAEVAAAVGHRTLDQVMRYMTDLRARSGEPVGSRIPSMKGRRS